MALVGAGMSLLWVPKHPLGQPVYSHQGKFGYSLINVLDPNTAGTMVEAIQADGNPTWLDQIRGRFLHPSDESLNRYVAEVLGTAQGDAVEPVHEVVGDDDDVEVPVDPSTQLESRKRVRTDRSGRREGKPEGKAAGSSRVGEKSQQSDPDDSATLSEHMKKKALDDHKRRLDEQAAAVFAAKKAKLQKEAPPAPSESEIDLGVFSGGRGNLLEEIFAASAPPVKIGKKPRAVDISQITPPTSPPSRTVGLTPPRDDVDAGTRGVEGFAEGVAEGGVAPGGDGGADGGADKGKGIEVEGESSETTPQQTIYTKRPPGGGGATSGAVRSPHVERYLDDSWGNPTCDDLPHAPRWNLTQGSRMNDVNNCHEFFAMSLPPAKRMFQKNRNRFSLLDDHVRAGVNFFATSQEILREWRSMGEETLEFEQSKKSFVEEREKFNAEKKGLQWRVSDAEQKLEEQKQLNAQKQKDWEAACERTNVELQSQRDAIVRLSGEKTNLAEEANQARLAAEKKEKEYVARIDKLELLAQEKATECETAQRLLAEKTAECQASELLAEEASADSRWLLSRGVPLLADRILHSPELATYMFELGRAAYNSGRKFGYAEGKTAFINKEKDYHFELYKEDCEGAFTAKRGEFSTLEFAVVRAAEKLARKVDGVALLKKALGEDSDAAGGAGPNQT
ncbi:hypothetical protein HanPI659440_Chr07g0256731 [Helianthus annuus]|nr:hypothetical protein HanPI659440_Chr07g0256731 [Helianthus annuus]